MKPLLLSRFTTTSCIGHGLSQTLDAMRQRRSGLTHCDFDTVDLDTYIGQVAGVDDVVIRSDFRDYDCRNNRLLQMTLEQDGFAEAVNAAAQKYGHGRIGVFLGTSTAGILQTELAYRRRNATSGALPTDFIYRSTHNTFSATDFTQRYFGLSGPAATISSACSSSAKVFASARRMIEAGIIDAAVVGGVDSLCLTTLYGFNSLGLLSSQACRPYDDARNGISIGEAAAVVLLERMPDALDADAVLLLGIGESSDAHHMSSPHPDGLGARIAMQNALAMANLRPDQIDYINLHGTATQTNDAAEGKAVNALFGTTTACSSTKGATGHTLGAAGGVEAVICALALQHGLLPGGVNTMRLDPALALNYLLQNQAQRVDRVLTNSFGFGGTNCSLIFARATQSPP
ncbi:MAG: beta-ketoacyl-[acyl-carrier-protein] synthase family protein [Burkholderiaceae bacterium]